MIISRTPFRVSLFGGGTDYPAFFEKHGGAVLGSSINQYCYIMLRKLPPNFQNRYRLVYKNEEFVDSIDDIHHPVIRECLRYMEIEDGMEIIHWSDMPARKGMGSSSAFTVGLLNALHRYKGIEISKYDMATKAVEIEQDWVKENVGCQDQYLTALGGMNLIYFDKSTSILPQMSSVDKYLMLFDTGLSHYASEIAGEIINNIPQRTDVLLGMKKLARDSVGVLDKPLEIGKMLGLTWKMKKLVSSVVSNPAIDKMYDKGISLGATSGKLLGAGQGGYLLFFVEPKHQEAVRNGMGLKEVKFKFESHGTEIIFDNVT